MNLIDRNRATRALRSLAAILVVGFVLARVASELPVRLRFGATLALPSAKKTFTFFR